MPVSNETQADVAYTSIDLTTSGATTVFNPSHDGAAYGVYMDNNTTSGNVQLELSDGSSTTAIANPSQGSALEFGNTVPMDGDDLLKINVTATAASGSETAAVPKVE